MKVAWTLESGHTAAGFKVRHMMVSWVRGRFSDVHGTIVIDGDDLTTAEVDVTIDATLLDSGLAMRDDHLKNADFLDVEKFPTISFKSTKLEQIGENDYVMYGDLTVRGITKNVRMDVRYNGLWQTPWWVEKDGVFVNEGPKPRMGFVAKGVINRHDFGVSWQGEMDNGGLVVGNDVHLVIDAEAYRE
jgi:polyisoprenoid-binding protein YceI